MMDYVIAIIGGVVVFLTILWTILSAKKERFSSQYSHDRGRPMGAIENIWRTIHEANGGLILANTLVLRSKEPIQESVVKKAMQLLMKRHPLLRMCIRKNREGDYCLQKIETSGVDLRQLDTKDWRRAMEETLLEKFDTENGPLWRVTCLPNARYESQTGTETDGDNMTSHPHECICIFNFHHSIIDGSSYSRIFAEFMSYIGKLDNNEEPEVTSMPMLPPLDFYLDEIIPLKWYHHVFKLVLALCCIIPGFPSFIMRVMGRKADEGNAFTRKYGLEIQRNPQITLKTKIIPVEFTKDETTCLLKKCKDHQTTVQGAIQTAAGVAIVTMLEEKEFKVESVVTVNARPYFKSKVPNEYAGSYLAVLQCENIIGLSPDPVKFWSTAKNASEDLHSRLKRNEHMKMGLLFYFMSPLFITRMTSNREEKKDDSSGGRNRQHLVFTNLGYCKFLDASPDDDVILRARYGCSAGHHQEHIFGNNLATFNGKLFWTFIYYSNITGDNAAQKYADLVKTCILKVIND